MDNLQPEQPISENNETTENFNKPSHYGADDIQVLEGLEPVRVRPAMYIGSTGESGLHHLVFEVVDNSIDEALAGICTQVDVTIHKDDSITVVDNGRGIPTDIVPGENKSGVEVVMTILHAGGKFGGSGYKVSGGLHGVGVSCVNALSERLEVTVYRDGRISKMAFERGKVVEPLTDLGPTDKRGTKVWFKPDNQIFSETKYQYEILSERLRELAFLNKGIKITLKDERGDGTEDVFHYEGGIVQFVSHLNQNKEPLHEQVIYIDVKKDGIETEIAFQWNKSYSEDIYSFANNINTREGGSHLLGFKSALTRVINKYVREKKLLKEKESNFSGEDVREGLTAVISVKLPNPQFEGQTKTKLGNPEIKNIVESIIDEKFGIFLEETPDTGKVIFEKSLSASKARDAAKKARDDVRRKGLLDKMSSLPGKLADCSEKDPSKCELYIVEGDSAGGSAKQGRDRHYQAILPLRGKVLNVQRVRTSEALKNEEIRTLITALGTGIDEDFDISKLRYDKIIIMTDADVDGAHIRTLILTFFYHFMRELIMTGHVYIAQPPLFKLKKNKNEKYAYSDSERDSIINELGDNVLIQRYKGLGEMNPEQLWETTMDPANRFMTQVSLHDKFVADEIFHTLMGDDPKLRRAFIESHASKVKNLDI